MSLVDNLVQMDVGWYPCGFRGLYSTLRIGMIGPRNTSCNSQKTVLLSGPRCATPKYAHIGTVSDSLEMAKERRERCGSLEASRATKSNAVSNQM